MAQSKGKIIAKLLLLLGLPLALIGGLFLAGVYTGVRHSHAVTKFEYEVLGLDVEITAPPRPNNGDASPSPATPAAAPGPAPGAPERGTGGAEAATTVGESAAAPGTGADGRPPQPGTDPHERPTTPSSTPSATRDPLAWWSRATWPALTGTEAGALAKTRVVKVAMLVAPEVVGANEDWIAYARTNLAVATGLLRDAVGVRLELVAVLRGAGGSASRELTQASAYADIVLLLAGTAAEAEVLGGDREHHAWGVVVPMGDGQAPPHAQPLLRGLGEALGAEVISDATDEAWKSGSWMRLAPLGELEEVTLDAANRGRILRMKQREFARPAVELPEQVDEEGRPTEVEDG